VSEFRPAIEFLPSIHEHPYVRELEARLKMACEPCAECGHVDYRELDDILDGEPAEEDANEARA
jgi:hypothetical protein